MLVIEGTNPITIQKIKDTNTIESLWVSDTMLYNSNGDIVGKINKEKGKIKLFTMSA